ncbi:MAG: dihydroneopterin aldolase [Bacteroidales bacterium]|nr:dihydroneopterin aldolase [Bacteroidales bacterium]MCF8403492.1 dihydroneopterin aldolase [Bacteroidales bacterium]
MATISIEGMEFHAYHGCFKEEQIIGNTFIVDIHLVTDTTESEQTDKLDLTVNYADVYEIAKEQMATKSKLLEHVARRIMDVTLDQFPEIDFIEIKISKLNPPVGGKVHSVSVTIDNIEE